MESSYRVSLTAMFTAFGLIFLYLSAILPTGRIALLFISSIFVAGLLVEDQPGLAFLSFIMVGGLGLLLVPNLLMVLPYALLFGHYGIGKYFLEKIRDKVVSFVCKLVYFDLGLTGIYFLAGELFFGSLLESIPLWLLVVLAQIAFVIFDFLYSKVVLLYEHTIRPKLVRG